MRESLGYIRILLILAVSTLLLGYGSQNTRSSGHAPVIIDAYAASAARPGETWKVFLHTKDIDGDMDHLRFMVYLPDSGISPTTFIWIKKNYRGEFVGCFRLNIPADNAFIGRKFILKAIVRDQRGNRSKPVKLTATFESVTKEDISERWQVGDKNRMSSTRVDISSLDTWRSITWAPSKDFHYALMYIGSGLISMY